MWTCAIRETGLSLHQMQKIAPFFSGAASARSTLSGNRDAARAEEHDPVLTILI
jgi:hypothetical protein